MQVAGVVVGKGFRFGYKALGDTQSLLSLGQHYGLGVSVVDLVAETGKLKVRHQPRMLPTPDESASSTATYHLFA